MSGVLRYTKPHPYTSHRKNATPKHFYTFAFLPATPMCVVYAGWLTEPGLWDAILARIAFSSYLAYLQYPAVFLVQ